MAAWRKKKRKKKKKKRAENNDEVREMGVARGVEYQERVGCVGGG